MITLLAKYRIANYENYKDPKVRKEYGMLAGSVGIALNLFLFLIKFVGGLLSNSIAITADAFNNLSDAGSSVITLLGFKLASAKPDPEHPFGHGRIEYVAGLAVSGLILLMGFELLGESVQKILHPEETYFSPLVLFILLASIAVKIYMGIYNLSLAKKLDSATMKATATDSFSDTLATTMVLISMLVGTFTDFHTDGIFGVLVALIILYAAVSAAKDVINPLLGQPPTKEFVERIEAIVMAQEGIVGIHDLVVHDYGPGRVMISLHAEVPADVSILDSHDVIDATEHLLAKELSCTALIHMDPVVVDDPRVTELKKMVATLVRNWNKEATIHDFRVVFGNAKSNLVFDVVAPYAVTESDDEIRRDIQEKVRREIGEQYIAVITVDRAYV